MKQLVVILSLILTLVVAGLLYATHTEPDEYKTVRTSNLHMDHFPDPMPPIVMDPMVGTSLF